MFILHPAVHLVSLVAHDAWCEHDEQGRNVKLPVWQPREPVIHQESIRLFQHDVLLLLEPEFPFVKVAYLLVTREKGVRSVSFWPKLNNELEQVWSSFGYGQGELVEHICRRWAKHNKLRQASDVQILAHEKTSLLAAINRCHYVVEIAIRLVEFASDTINRWLHLVTELAVLNLEEEEPVWHFPVDWVLENGLCAVSP